MTNVRDADVVLREFAEQGFARLGRVADDATLEALRNRADDLMLGRVTYDGMFFQLDTDTGRYDDLEYGKGYQGPSLDYRKVEKLERDPLFLQWIENPAFEPIVRALVGPSVVLYRALLMTKSARGGTNLPWHQDGGRFWGLDKDPVLQIWTALDDAPAEAGCVEIVPGSHLWGLATPLGGVVPAPWVEAKTPESLAVSLPARAGEVILIHNYAWHRSGTNRTGHTRRGLTVCYMDAATRCQRKKRAPRQFFPVFQAHR